MHIGDHEIKKGDALIAAIDSSACLVMGKHYEVYEDSSGLYVICKLGDHYLDGNLEGELLGFYLVD